MKKIIVGVLATVAIAATALITVPALAKDAPVHTQASIQTQAQVQTQVTATNSLYVGYGAAFCGGRLAMNDEATLQRVASVLGISYDQLVQRLAKGETIASIATAQKVALSKVVDVVVAAQTDMVNLMVKYGYVTQDQATTIIADLKTRVEAALSGTTPASDYAYGCYGINGSAASPDAAYGYGCYGVTDATTTPGTSYGCGMMGGNGIGRGMMSR